MTPSTPSGFEPTEPNEYDTSSFEGALRVRIATAVDTREAVVAAFSAVAEQMPTWFPGEEPMAAPEVAALVDRVISEHNEGLERANEEAIRLLDVLDELPTVGVISSFADGADEAGALQAVMARAAAFIELGATARAYCWSTADEAALLVCEGYLPMHYGVFAESGATTAEVLSSIRTALRRQELPEAEHDPERQVLTIGPISYRVPFHGFALHELPATGTGAQDLPELPR